MMRKSRRGARWLPGIMCVPLGAGRRSAPSALPLRIRPSDHGAVVTKYCVTCHNERAKTGGLALDTLDIANPVAAADVWEQVVRKVRVGMMPPQGAPRPDAEARSRARLVPDDRARSRGGGASESRAGRWSTG